MSSTRSARVIALFGPTASGKTAVAEDVADRLGTEVVSADALQVYRGLALLTAQPSRPTRLVAIREVGASMSVGEYARLAHDAIDELVRERGVAVVAGGTGLYLRAAIADLRIPEAPAPGSRARWEALVEADPAQAHARLRELDPAAARLVHPNDRRRVVRALELAEAGRSLAPDEDRLWEGPPRHPTLVLGLDVPPAVLEERIRLRAVQMFHAGVVDEVRAAVTAGVSRTAAQALGMREILELPPDQALERLVVRTRRYAAYQRKWMRRIPGIVVVDANRAPTSVAQEILALAEVADRRRPTARGDQPPVR
jgi:tRNA dimethylallyltransferase